VTRLLAVEFRRFFARRAIRVIVLLAVLGCILAGVIVLFTARSSAEDEAFIRQQREINFNNCMSFFQSDQGEGQLPPGQSAEEVCRAQSDSIQPGGGFLFDALDEILVGTSILLAMIGVILGATFIGAEWSSGSMGTLLTWESRRHRVLLSKAVAVVLCSFLIAIALQVFLALALLPAALINDAMGVTGAAWFRATSGVAFRAAIGTSIVALLGASIASIGRNTSAALGAVFAYFVIVENLLRGFKPHWASWFFGENFGVFIVGNTDEAPIIGHGVIESGMYLIGYTLIAFLAALVLFQRRDIT
jgi:ABC-type transport system involved in multi-copper enzyme maturation permease subunit